MGFFGSLEKFCNDLDKMVNEEPKKGRYSESELKDYFRCEIRGSQKCTTIYEIIKRRVKAKCPNLAYWLDMREGSCVVEKLSDSEYKIIYKGTIKQLKDDYGDDIFRSFRYDVVIYTDTDAELLPDKDSTVTISD